MTWKLYENNTIVQLIGKSNTNRFLPWHRMSVNSEMACRFRTQESADRATLLGCKGFVTRKAVAHGRRLQNAIATTMSFEH